MLFIIIVRNLIGNPLRTALTTLAAAMCVIAFLLLRMISMGWGMGQAISSNEFYTRHALSILARFPVRTVEKVQKLPFVANATPILLFPMESPSKTGEVVGGVAVDAEQFLAIRSKTSIGVSDDVRDRWVKTRDGLLIGSKVAEQEHWKAGDVVSLKSLWFRLPNDEPWKFTIAGVYTPTSSGDDGTSVWAHYVYINTAVEASQRELTSGIAFSCKPGTAIADAPKQVDAALAQDLPTLTTDIAAQTQSLKGMFGAFLVVMDTLSTIFVAIVVLLLVNTITLGVRERTTHYAVMRAMGFRPKTVAILIAGESVALALAGTILGCLVSIFLINRLVGPALENTIPFVRLKAPTVILTIVVAGVLGALAAVPAFLSVMRRKLTDALRFAG